jgi:hypothetical protein
MEDDLMTTCEHCGSDRMKVILTVEEKTLHLCRNCYNELLSEELEVELEPLVETFSLKDYQGNSRTFNVERQLHPVGICLEASEDTEFGYRFAVHGELDSNQFELFQRLIEKVRKGIGKQHVERGVFPNGQAYHTMMNDQIVGVVEYDEAFDGTPLIIIDGEPFSWEEVGKMVMSYEGFQIKIKVLRWGRMWSEGEHVAKLIQVAVTPRLANELDIPRFERLAH